jgi:aminoglycoside 6'-N-acetyltransferase
MATPTVVFRPLTAGDLPQIHRWFDAPHARRWFDKGSLDQVAAEYLPYIEGSVPIHAFIVALGGAGGREIGLVEWERFGDFPEAQATYRVTDPNAANCDILIGEPDAAYQGWGPRIVRSLLQEIVFADPRITTCIIDPSPDNAIAIRAYEKVGFHFLRAVPEDGEGLALYLMELTRAELAGAGPQPGEPFIRPARDGELAVAAAIDGDACRAYAEFDPGLEMVALADDHPVVHPFVHPFVLAKVGRRAEALSQRRLLLACTGAGQPVGFAAMGLCEGRPLLLELSVRRAFMRQGLGRALLLRALRWSVRPGELWLTTYQHVPFNQPWYQRLGFAPVADADCPSGIGAILAAERAALPQGDRRTAMVYRYPPT